MFSFSRKNPFRTIVYMSNSKAVRNVTFLLKFKWIQKKTIFVESQVFWEYIHIEYFFPFRKKDASWIRQVADQQQQQQQQQQSEISKQSTANDFIENTDITDTLIPGSPPAIPPKPPKRDETITTFQNGRETTTSYNEFERNSTLSTTHTPQMEDNLVRRTSDQNKLLVLTGEEKERILSASDRSYDARNRGDVTTTETNDEAEQRRREQVENHHLGPRKSSSIKKRETFDSAFIRRHVTTSTSATTTTMSGQHENENGDEKNRLSIDTSRLRRRHSDVPEGKREEKRLVVVDSTYINVSSVGDGYTKMNNPLIQQQMSIRRNSSLKDQRENSENRETRYPERTENREIRYPENREKRASSTGSEWTAVAITTRYKTDQESLKPFDSSSIDVTLSSQISDTYYDTSNERLNPDSPREVLNYSNNSNISREVKSDNYACNNDNESYQSNSAPHRDNYREHLPPDSFASEQQERFIPPSKEPFKSENYTSSALATNKEHRRHTSDSYTPENHPSHQSEARGIGSTGTRRRHLDSMETTTSSSLHASNLSLLTSSNSSLPSNFSTEEPFPCDEPMSRLSLSTEHLPTQAPQIPNPDGLSVSSNTTTSIDGHAHSSLHPEGEKVKAKKQKKEKHHKDKKKHKHKKNSKQPKETNEHLEALARKTKSFDSLAPASRSGGPPIGHSSDDSKSIDSFDSLEDFNQPQQHPTGSTRPAPSSKTARYYSSSDSNRTTPEKSLDSELTRNTAPNRTQSPQCLDGDAKLVS